MKSFLKFFIPLFILGALAYSFRADIQNRFLPELASLLEHVKSRIAPSAPCAKPIHYTLGNFDTKFGISKEYFLSALREAETVWEKEQGDYLGKNLFTYVPEGSPRDVKVNLVYDYRQQATSKLKSLGIVVSNNRASYDMLKAKFTALKISYEKEKSSFNARVTAFNQKQNAYEKDVAYWNARGGAPEGEYNKLQATQSALKAESKQIQILQNNLNAKAEEINAMVVVLNRLITSLNLSVDKYNTTNDVRGESFEEGVYTSDGVTSEIDIYEFSSRDKLVRVLAHELGHALGLEHMADPKAMMYELNQGTSMSLTDADLTALRAKCGIK